MHTPARAPRNRRAHVGTYTAGTRRTTIVLAHREFLGLARSLIQRHHPFEEMLRMFMGPLLRDTTAGRYLAPS